MCEKAQTQPTVLLQDPRKIVTVRLAVIGLRPYVFILYHFFESFRAILAYTSECKGAWGTYLWVFYFPHRETCFGVLVTSLNAHPRREILTSFSSLGDTRIVNTISFIESWLLARYMAAATSRVLRLWEQIMRLVYRKLRPATYATKVERTLRGWTHPPASETDIRDVLVFGGLEALYVRFLQLNAYPGLEILTSNSHHSV